MISLELRLYFIVYTSSRHHTDTVSETVPDRCCVVPQLECEVYQLVTLVSLLVIDRDGFIG